MSDIKFTNLDGNRLAEHVRSTLSRLDQVLALAKVGAISMARVQSELDAILAQADAMLAEASQAVDALTAFTTQARARIAAVHEKKVSAS